MSKRPTRSGYAVPWPVLSPGSAMPSGRSSIFAAIRSHWRRTFRVLPQWADKIAGLRAQRVAGDAGATWPGRRALLLDDVRTLAGVGVDLVLRPTWTT